jgi:hypothetical protein
MHEGDRILSLVHQAASQERAAQERATRLLEMASLRIETPVERIYAALKGEIAFLLRGALSALQQLPSSEKNQGFFRKAIHLLQLGGGAFPRGELSDLVDEIEQKKNGSQDPELEGLVRALQSSIEKHIALERRVSYLLSPSSCEELQKLDPRLDCDQITHSISYHFRAERYLFTHLYQTRPLIVPHARTFFFGVGEFMVRGAKRLIDTTLVFENTNNWGLESERGQKAIARLNEIHGRYNIPNDTFKFVLANNMFAPIIWNERVGWRKFTEVERLGWFYQQVKIGRAMNIQGISDDYEEMRQWWEAAGELLANASDLTRRSFENLTAPMLVGFPEDLWPFLTQALIAGMDDKFRECALYPEPPPEVMEAVRKIFFTAGVLGAYLPRGPWIPSLHHYEVYPYGYQVEELGVSRRGFLMPKIPSATLPLNSNSGYPEGVKPITALENIPAVELPFISLEEVRKHSSPSDGWIVIADYVYNVTSFITSHPGGHEVLIRNLGKDATAAFQKVGHSAGAVILATNFRIGRVQKPSEAALVDEAQH